jgi:hypothetical protein
LLGWQCFLIYPTLCQAAPTFNVNGYEITVVHQQEGEKELWAWGNVHGGKTCKQLNLSIFFRNSQESNIARVDAAIKDYLPAYYTKYKAADKIYASKSAKQYWFVDSISTKCLK